MNAREKTFLKVEKNVFLTKFLENYTVIVIRIFSECLVLKYIIYKLFKFWVIVLFMISIIIIITLRSFQSIFITLR